jgi:hypothetical protein
MMIHRCFLKLFTLLSALLVVSCSSAAAPSATSPTSVPAPIIVATQVPVATTAPTQIPASTLAPKVVATQAPVATTAPTLAPTIAPTQPPKPTALLANGTAVPTSKPGTFGRAEVDKIFPPGKGQDLVFQACTNCHNWVPLVMAGFDNNAWEQNKLNHRNRVSGLSDSDFNYLYNYLEQTFPAGHPVPTNIPADLLQEWTSY